MTIPHPSPYCAASNAADALLAAHPDLPALSVDVAHVRGLGPAALIQVAGRPALKAWAQALNTTAHITGASAYGTTEPHEAGMPQWLWWRMTYIDTAVGRMPIRLWTLDTTDQPRALAAFLATTVHAPPAPSGDRTRTPNHPNTLEENSR
ncbi:hypothetical protein [Streptomyces hokutonensis]|uniref:hypothetical protein n=1 Tax=Streptomyces hokutonensis TaxID=1306990 RepID=UPI000377B78E|nr:hypothetical protein [Streptomyces hokutonensis]